MQQLILKCHLSPGDIVMLTAAVRDLSISYPKKYSIKVDSGCNQIWENNPYLAKEEFVSPKIIECNYPLIDTSNEGCHHFIHGFIQDLNSQLNINIKPTLLRGDIYISDQEKSWYSQIHEILGKDVPFWIVDAGCKNDYTCKLWEIARYQQVVNAFPDIYFVQIGSNDSGHIHIPLKGDNLINLVGKTDIRQLIRLTYHAAGVITPVSLPMHLAVATPTNPKYNRKSRPCIVIAGGREPSIWEAYTNHAYLHTCGMLPCCDNGGCWKSRITKLFDNDKQDKSLCLNPITTKSGQVIPKCLDMITAEEIIQKIKNYLLF